MGTLARRDTNSVDQSQFFKGSARFDVLNVACRVRNWWCSLLPVDLIDGDLVHDAGLLRVEFVILPGVLVRKMVDMVLCALFCGVGNMAAYFCPVIIVGRIEQQQTHFGALGHIPILLPTTSGVDPDVFAVVIDPDGSRLRLSTRHNGCQCRNHWFFKQITYFIQYRSHDSFPPRDDPANL